MKAVFRLILSVMLIISIALLSSCVSGRLVQREKDELTGTDDENTKKNDNIQPGDVDVISTPSAASEFPKDGEESNTEAPSDTEAEAVVEVSWEDTIGPGTTISDLNDYGLNKRLKGLIDDSQPYGVDDYTNGIAAAGDIYILNERYKDDIIGGIKLGDSFSRVREVLDQPGWETDDILLYRCWNYYIFFYGNQEVLYAAISKAPDTNYDKYILSTIIQVLNSSNYNSLDESIPEIDAEGTFFDDRGFINGGGYYASSKRGIVIVDFDEQYIEVYNNYQGNLYNSTDSHPRYQVRFIDRDLTIDMMLNEFNRYLEIEELFKNEGAVSPDGSLTAVYEWIYSMDQHFIIRTLDHSIQDRYIYASTTGKFYWLTNHHIIYIDTYNEVPYALDVNFSQPSAINILYEAGVIEERDVDSGKYKFEIKEITNDTISLIDSSNNKIYNIQFTEGKNGEVYFIKK